MRLLIALAAAAIVFGALERVAAAVPRKRLLRRERAVDFLWWFFTPWVSKTAGQIAIALAVGLLTLIAPKPSTAWFDRQPVALQIVELLVAADLLGYAAHRMFHGKRLWRYHAVHHSAEDLDWLSAARVHPINEVGQRLVQVIPLYLLGFHGKPLAALVPILTVYALFVHANLRWDFGPLRYVIATPAFHRWHHTSEEEGLDRNFAGLFPWIDLLFSTFHMQRGRQAQRFGLKDEALPSGLLGQLAYPFLVAHPARALPQLLEEAEAPLQLVGGDGVHERAVCLVPAAAGLGQRAAPLAGEGEAAGLGPRRGADLQQPFPLQEGEVAREGRAVELHLLGEQAEGRLLGRGYDGQQRQLHGRHPGVGEIGVVVAGNEALGLAEVHAEARACHSQTLLPARLRLALGHGDPPSSSPPIVV